MPLILNEEQEMLQDAANGFLTEKAPVSAFRKVRDEKPADGFCRELWAEMAEMGWAGIIVDESHGGSGFGYVGAGVLAEQMGKSRRMRIWQPSAVANGCLPWRLTRDPATIPAASISRPSRPATALS